MNDRTQSDSDQNRIQSVDFFRGITLFVLVTGISEIFAELVNSGKAGPFISLIHSQFSHGVWYELHFWDLIQPFFMFIVGVAMPFSVMKRLARGESHQDIFRHALIRSFWLLVLGFMLGAKEHAYYLTNILPQLAFTYPIAFLIMRKKIELQLFISFAVIIFSDLIYRYWPVEGYNQLIPEHNFGVWLDLNTTGHAHPGNWVTFNAIPTLAHIIWGVITGKILMNNWTQKRKMLTLTSAGFIGLIIGFSLRPFIPIIEHISTSSFVIVSGGWAFLAMAASYWIVDVMKIRKLPSFFAIFGMNSIFLYIFSTLDGGLLLKRMVIPFTSRIFSWAGEIAISMITISVVAALFWYISYFLYRRKIFFKL